MNLLLITIRSDFGGGSKHVDQLISYLPAEYNIYVACPQEEPFGISWAKHPRIFGYFELPHRKFKLIKFYQLQKWICNKKIDIIHSHGKGAGIYSRLIKIFIPTIKIIHTFHGLNKGDNYIKYIPYWLIEKCFILLTSKYIFVSYGERDKAKNFKLFSNSKSYVIYNGVVDPVIERTMSKKDGIIRIVSISRFDYAKNMDLAYDISKEFKGEPTINFIWIGDGEHKKRLEDRAKREQLNVEFTGFKDPFPILENCDILMSTSRSEGLPYALIEATSMGIPIVASNVTGNNEVVRDGVNGFLFNTRLEAVNSIRELIVNEELRRNFGKNSRHYYLTNFTIEKMINDLIKIYKSV